MKRLCIAFAFVLAAQAAEPQNPSPMVEHTREHPRLKEEQPAGKREKLDAGTLFIPQAIVDRKEAPLLIFMHGGTWIPEIAAAKHGMAALVIQRGDGYKALFEKEDAFESLMDSAATRSGMKWTQITVGGWSAGCQGIRAMLRHASAVKRIDRVIHFLDTLPKETEASAFLSFDSPTMTTFASPWVRTMLEKLGMRPDAPIDSPMVTRGLKKALAKLEQRVVGNQPADSLADWMQRNLRHE